MVKLLFSIPLSLKILILSLGFWVIPVPINAEQTPVVPYDTEGGTEDTKPGGTRLIPDYHKKPGLRRDTQPGRTRDQCLTSENLKPLTALVPKSDKQLELTISPHPSLLIYFPPSQAQTADFVIYNNNTNQLVYKSTFDLQKNGGILRITLPPNSPELQTEIPYRWTVQLNCPGSNPPFIQGLIQRNIPTPELTQELAKNPTNQHWLIYAKAGIWHDAIANLAEQLRQNPNDQQLKENWQKLLNEVELNLIVTEPLI
ncbi:hypothetical protein PCC9214_00344 [Planktothrix tepida]|uniref:DUF928 domain-containing protein n=2 Tax=Planktothrix TaxID=54304 RepID=A0A1J1LEI3_9CYAN|nr:MULTISPECIES: DUF928 domain-containing protein [Planktothrix]CAD5916004.1 hypothetical protein PCC9214_00344 [Planktothrix tepida]CAD5985746.1 hypothetical protein NO713_05464 [Planktothrix pseudagardhii]CUR30402.1 exported hypothetical protein [Planktothrix tepida PCC 9214]